MWNHLKQIIYSHRLTEDEALKLCEFAEQNEARFSIELACEGEPRTHHRIGNWYFDEFYHEFSVKVLGKPEYTCPVCSKKSIYESILLDCWVCKSREKYKNILKINFNGKE